jgi:hypothetical protein
LKEKKNPNTQAFLLQEMIERTKFVKLKLMTKWENPYSPQISTRCKTGKERNFRIAQRTIKYGYRTVM